MPQAFSLGTARAELGPRSALAAAYIGSIGGPAILGRSWMAPTALRSSRGPTLTQTA
jgi:hypothetical protein